MSDRHPRVVDRGLVPVHETVRALCSEQGRACCDAEVADFLGAPPDPATAGPGPGRPVTRAWRCTLRHRRDASLAVGLAAATPHSMQDTLDRSLVALLRASADHHRRRCLAPEPPAPRGGAT
jgi:hypothetical protein